MAPGVVEEEVATAVDVGKPLVTVPLTEPGEAAVVAALAPNSDAQDREALAVVRSHSPVALVGQMSGRLYTIRGNWC